MNETLRQQAVEAGARALQAERDAARAELQEWAEPYRREVLADLRAKVEGLYVRCTDDPWRNEELTDWVRRDAVLALIDGAQ